MGCHGFGHVKSSHNRMLNDWRFHVVAAVAGVVVDGVVAVAGQTLERNAEDISILLGRGINMAKSLRVQDNINMAQQYIELYGPYR